MSLLADPLGVGTDRRMLSTAVRGILVAFYVFSAAAVYLLFAALGSLAIAVTLFFVAPDPCLPFCVTAETHGGEAQAWARNVVLVGAGVAYLVALLPLFRRWGTGRVFLVPVIAFLLVTPLAVTGLLTVDVLTTDPVTVSCSC